MTVVVVDDHVQPIREASRKLVRELGFLKGSLAGSGYPPSAVHAIVEIGARGSMKASELCEVLALEKSSVSRMVKKLVGAGVLSQASYEGDGRSKCLELTAAGRDALERIHIFADRQVTDALRRLPPSSRITVREGLQHYSDALASARTGRPVARQSPHIERGLRPGALGRIVEMHARYYAGIAGFGSYFESKVASELAGFAARLGNPRNAIWLVVGERDTVLGSIAIDGEDLGHPLAHLRWFIIDDSARGLGMGHLLLQRALEFVETNGFSETHLWTFRGLDAARHLYEAEGFVLDEETIGNQWGTAVTEQKFIRLQALPDGASS